MLYVTADDFGIGYDTSRGIVEAHEAGALDATSVMTATGDHLLRSAELLHRTAGLRLGLHLTLTTPAGAPLTAGGRHLAVSGRAFGSLGRLYLLCRAGRVSPAAVEEEVLAQLSRFVSVVGRAPQHVDGHQHCHQLPVVREVLARLVRDGTLPRRVRSTPEPPELRAVAGAWARRVVIRRLGKSARPSFASAGAELPDGFFGVLSERMLALTDPWEPYLSRLPRETSQAVELGVHPGFPDESLHDRDTYIRFRVKELDALRRIAPRLALLRYGPRT